MKVHQFARGLWDYEPSSSLTLGCKRLRPLVPKLDSHSFDLKTFIRPEGGPRKLPAGFSGEYGDSSSPPHVPSQPHQVDAQQGGTRWNPTEEQVSILEMLYRKGLRTPKTQQIEQITAELGKYGKIEGKNVFYWFQNHKARERQKQKRNSLGLAHTPRTPPPAATANAVNLDVSRSVVVDIEREGDSGPRRVMCRSWALEMSSMDSDDKSSSSMEGGDRTLELFPLHPESR